MYSDTTEYRQFLRQITEMKRGKYYSDDTYSINPSSAELDTETLDEFEYDDLAMSVFLDHVYSLTKESPIFQELYSAAAALMFSTDLEIGLAVLCSYDYLADFYACFLAHTTVDSGNPVQTIEEYIRLYKSLHLRR